MTWGAANHIARLAMGTKQEPGRYGKTVWLADEDPLACWCLTELIKDGVSLAVVDSSTIEGKPK